MGHLKHLLLQHQLQDRRKFIIKYLLLPRGEQNQFFYPLHSSRPVSLINTLAFVATAEYCFSFIAKCIVFSSKQTNLDVISFLSKSLSSISELITSFAAMLLAMPSSGLEPETSPLPREKLKL